MHGGYSLHALRAAHCRLSNCFQLTVWLLSCCFSFALGLALDRFPVSWRRCSGCFPIVAGLRTDCGCFLDDLRLPCRCSRSASQLQGGILSRGSRLLSACFSTATKWFVGAVPLFCDTIRGLHQAANAAHVRDAWQPKNRCTRHAAYAC